MRHKTIGVSALGALATLTALTMLVLSCSVEGSTGGLDTSGREKHLINVDKNGMAVQGFDVVAYFTEGKPIAGLPRYRSEWGGAKYQFQSAQHQKMFESDPEKYVPQFGGYCAYAASINRISPIDPQFWEIVDGRLILQHNQRATDAWHEAPAENLKKADSNWPGLVARHGSAEKILVNVDSQGVAVEGYDVVAYFTEGRPVMGAAENESMFGGAKYHFSSKQNRETFENDPGKYLPQFGGYCAYAASINKISPIDPQFWQITDGRLLLQHTQKAYDLFNRDPLQNLDKADRNWPKLVERNGK